MKTVEHVIIGKDIARTAALTSSTLYATNSASTQLAEGEVVVCDKNKKLLAVGSTITDTDAIYIGVGLSTTSLNAYGYTNRDIQWAGPIFGRNTVAYTGRAYTASATKKMHILAGTIPSGQEAVLRIVYNDVEVTQLTPGQYVDQWNSVAGSSGAQNWVRKIVAKINADKNARVTATVATGGTGFSITGKTKSGTTLNDIDPRTLVDFTPTIYLAYARTAYAAPASYATATYTTWTSGEGNWEQVRDKEKMAKSNEGLINPTTFPIPTGFSNWLTVKDETYDCIVIKHHDVHKTSDMNYDKATDNATYIFIPNTTLSYQMQNVKDRLNTYFGSVGFDEITAF